MLRTLLMVLCVVAASQQLEIPKFSVPEAVEKGSDAELICEHDGSEKVSIVKWFWNQDGAEKPVQIYQRAFGGEKKIIIPKTEPLLNITLIEEDKHNLALWDLQPEHSGTFECQVEEEANFMERRIASPMVVYSIGDGPKLSFEGEEDVLVVCEAAGVAPEPEITITYGDTTLNTTLLEGPVDGLYNVSTNATLARQDIEGVEVSCKLSFDNEAIASELLQVADMYHSDGWLATSTAAPDDATDSTESPEVSAALGTEPTPDGAERTTAVWALAALVTILHLQLM